MAELTTSALAPDTTAGPLHYPLTTIWGPQGNPCYGHILAATSTSPESCIPPHFSQVMNNHGIWENGYYSPGICPWGYSIGCTPTGPSVLGKPIYPSETVGLCVPMFVRVPLILIYCLDGTSQTNTLVTSLATKILGLSLGQF